MHFVARNVRASLGQFAIVVSNVRLRISLCKSEYSDTVTVYPSKLNRSPDGPKVLES